LSDIFIGFKAGGMADPRYNLSYIVQNWVDGMGKHIIAVASNYILSIEREAVWSYV
jgi:hypothetical protein